MTSEKNMEAVEAARAKFRPDRITTLYVGEFAPSGGDFFYHGNSAMTRHMQSAVQHSLGGGAAISWNASKPTAGISMISCSRP